MTAILPPTRRLWWKQPIDRLEGAWVIIALIWCLIMFTMMPLWHAIGKQNLSNESYRTTNEMFSAKVDAMVNQYKVREESSQNIPVVAPPAGSDVYLLSRLWQWYPLLELQKGKTYRLHLGSVDWNHGFSLQPLNINLQAVPGYETVISVTPDTTGEFTIVCNEYCGVGHHTMLGKIYVTE